MSFVKKTIVGIIVAVSLGHSGFALAACPIASLKETQFDCPWADHVREIKKIDSKLADVLRYFEQNIPDLSRELKSLQSSEGAMLSNLWGQSRNSDANAGGVIVPDTILAALEQLSGIGIRFDDDVVHAGMEHIYGYLFSNLQTPYGYKRWRWTNPEVGMELGLESNVWGPEAEAGNFFANTSFLLWAFATRELAEENPWTNEMRSKVSESLVERFSTARFTQIRIKEEFPVRRMGSVVLQTDLVAFPKQDGRKNDALLIYSVVEEGRRRLITAFPVAKGFYESFLSKEVGPVSDIKLRYNAYMKTVSGENYSRNRTRTLLMGQ